MVQKLASKARFLVSESETNVAALMHWIPSRCDFQIKWLERVLLHQFSAENLCIGQYGVSENSFYI